MCGNEVFISFLLFGRQRHLGGGFQIDHVSFTHRKLGETIPKFDLCIFFVPTIWTLFLKTWVSLSVYLDFKTI